VKRAMCVCAVLCIAACSNSRYGGEPVSGLTPQHVEASMPETIASYRKLVGLPADNPFRPHALQRLADLLLEYGETREANEAEEGSAATISEYDEAIKYYEELLYTYPDYPATDQVLYQLARAYAKQGELDRTRALLKQLVSQFPANDHVGEARFRLAELSFMDGDYAEAQTDYRAVLDLGQATPYYENALLKYSWTLFKREKYDEALKSFFSLIDRKLTPLQFDDVSGEPLALGQADKAIINDTLRGMMLIFAMNHDLDKFNEYAGHYGHPNYIHLLYQRLADLYHSEERYAQEGQIYQAYIERYPDSEYDAIFQLRVVDAYRFARDNPRVIEAKEAFLNRYWHSDAGLSGSPAYRYHLVRSAREYLNELSEYYHARYQKSHLAGDYSAAVKWYRLYLADFHDQPNAIEKHFLLAELLFEHGDYAAAGHEYEQVAYFYPLHPRSAEAGYGAVLSYQKLMESKKNADHSRMLLRNSALRFISTFPKDERVPNTALALAEADFKRGDRDNARFMVQLLFSVRKSIAPQQAYDAWMLLGHIAYQEQDYAHAEQCFLSARKQAVISTLQAHEAEQWQAASIYQQAEVLLARDEKRAALALLLRIPQEAPGSEVAAKATYDAAALQIELKEWPQSAALLETFKQRYPNNELQAEVPAKLAFVYMKLGRSMDAAQAYEQIAAVSHDAELGREALWQAAELYRESGDTGQAVRVYKRYLQNYTDADYRVFQARARLAKVYTAQRQFNSRDYWLREIINHARSADAKHDNAIQQLAARASFTLAEERYAEFEAIQLVEPLRETLGHKKQKMEDALAAYDRTAEYSDAEFVTAAAYRSGEIYLHLSKALLDSERPAGLDGEELEQYNLMLEEQAHPFEKKAIDIFKANVGRISDGVYNDWIKKSMAKLAKLLPVQYAKQELPSGVIHALH
jgi:tetratricopeptide (TPR) repeat protein